MEDKELEEELAKIKQLSRAIKSVILRMEYSSNWIKEYEDAVREYEVAKDELLKKLRER